MKEEREPAAEIREKSERQFVVFLALISAVFALLPTIIAWATAPAGSAYLGIQYNLDDHMVYAAWMQQAADGSLIFDNRFAIDEQPRLTINLYFLALGSIAKFLGIPLTLALSRAVFAAVLVFLLHRLARRVTPGVFATKLALTLSVFGGGIGFSLWHTFGQTIERDSYAPVSRLLMGRLPTDVWQPEGFVFSSILTNGLFVASLCLVIVAFLSILNAKESGKYVPHGAFATFLLANIHSYDMMLVGLVLLGFLTMAIVRKQVQGLWLLRSTVIALGSLPPALWLSHVLASDPVFQARAATETFSPNFRQVVLGYFFLFLFGIAALLIGQPNRNRVGGLALVGLMIFLLVFAGGHLHGYFLSPALWAGVLAVALVILAQLSTNGVATNLITSWAVIGLVAPYFPALFQRKLLMGLSIPWAILGAIAIAGMTKNLERGARNLVLTLFIILMSASSLRWFSREVELARINVSNTTSHAVHLGADVQSILSILRADSTKRIVVIAMPGVASMDNDDQGNPIPDTFGTPYLPDLNPILSGLAGVYTYAGHWSETPDYVNRRRESTKFFLAGSGTSDLLEKTQASYVVAPVPKAYPQLPLADLSGIGEILYDGTQFRLIRVR